MGPPGREDGYKYEMTAVQTKYQAAIKAGATPQEAGAERDRELALISQKYERELMNPKEALSLGSVSSIVMPGTTRRVLAKNLLFLISKYQPSPMSGVQREFE
jgi:acetyl-CoA carboxylase carboxyltransferase component